MFGNVTASGVHIVPAIKKKKWGDEIGRTVEFAIYSYMIRATRVSPDKNGAVSDAQISLFLVPQNVSGFRSFSRTDCNFGTSGVLCGTAPSSRLI